MATQGSYDAITRFKQLMGERKGKVVDNQPEVTEIRSTDAAEDGPRFSELNIEIPDLPAEYDVPELREQVALKMKMDFPDDCWREKPAIILSRLSDGETVRYGRKIIIALTSGISSYVIGLIFVVAFQLKKRLKPSKSENLFPPSDELARPSDIEVSLLEDTIMERAGMESEPSEKGRIAQIAQGYSFLAASLLRMFTRSPENYGKSWAHIVDGYAKFYSDPCPISGVVPKLTVLKRIHTHFSLSELMKATLYRFLYNSNNDGKILSIQKYLYDIHLSHTGMHIIPISYRICQTMNCTPAQLIQVINSKRFAPQIKGLVAAFKLMKTVDEKHVRQLWKYGRIFDSEFLSSLQTRSCPMLAYILGCVLKRQNPKSAAGILEIKQLEEVGSEEGRNLFKASRKLVDAINHIVDGEDPEILC